MSSESDSAYVWSVSCDQRPDMWHLATGAFNFYLGWREILTRPERRLLIHWAASLETDDYTRWFDWAVGRSSRQMFHTLRDPLPVGDPRRVPDHVETRSMRRRRALLEQEPELIYRMRRQMEADLQQAAEEDTSSETWFVEWERRWVERRERERADAERAEAARLEAERRQRAHMASCSYRAICERASGAWARMRQAQAEEAAAAEADRRARDVGESSGSNQTVVEISDDEWIDISSDESAIYISSDESAV